MSPPWAWALRDIPSSRFRDLISLAAEPPDASLRFTRVGLLDSLSCCELCGVMRPVAMCSDKLSSGEGDPDDGVDGEGDTGSSRWSISCKMTHDEGEGKSVLTSNNLKHCVGTKCHTWCRENAISARKITENDVQGVTSIGRTQAPASHTTFSYIRCLKILRICSEATCSSKWPKWPARLAKSRRCEFLRSRSLLIHIWPANTPIITFKHLLLDKKRESYLRLNGYKVCTSYKYDMGCSYLNLGKAAELWAGFGKAPEGSWKVV